MKLGDPHPVDEFIFLIAATRKTELAMGWPYHIVKLSPEEKLQRRELLDRYGLYSQLSVLIPISCFWLYRLGHWAYHRWTWRDGYSAVTRAAESRTFDSGNFARRWRSIIWWLEDEVAPGWGAREHWIFGAAWALWLLTLCIYQTGTGELYFPTFAHASTNNLTQARLSSFNKALWDSSCGATPHTFHPCSQISIQSFSTDFQHIIRETATMAPNIGQTDISSDRCPCDIVPELLHPNGNTAGASHLARRHPRHYIIRIPFRYDEYQH